MESKLPAATQKKIIELWQLGLSGGQISEQVGMTRNAIIGFVSRQRAKGVELRSARRGRDTMPIKIPKKIISMMEAKLPPSQRRRLQIHELTNKSCRFIVSKVDSPVLYCGDTIEQHSYCKFHISVCYIPGKKR